MKEIWNDPLSNNIHRTSYLSISDCITCFFCGQFPGRYSFGLHAMKSAIKIATHRLYARRQVYQLTSGRDSQASGSMVLDGTEGRFFCNISHPTATNSHGNASLQ